MLPGRNDKNMKNRPARHTDHFQVEFYFPWHVSDIAHYPAQGINPQSLE
jgi:hypothetical protein